jgi:outer membrane protein
MKKIIIAAAIGMLVAGQVAAQESPWLVRARAVNLDFSNHDATGLGLGVKNKTIPEVDISYFFNKNVAAELILTVPQQLTVQSNGNDIGTFKALPPTVTLQYHFTNFEGFKPYVGAGLNFTKITHPNVLNGVAGLDDHGYGVALQAGVDVPVTKQISLNLDVKKVQVQSDVYAAGAKAGTLKLDPVLVGVGVGYRF